MSRRGRPQKDLTELNINGVKLLSLLAGVGMGYDDIARTLTKEGYPISTVTLERKYLKELQQGQEKK